MLKRVKQILFSMLILVMVLGTANISAGAIADGWGREAGSNVDWYFYAKTGVLEFTGSGPLAIRENGSYGWTSYKDYVTKITFTDSIDRIPSHAFENFLKLKSVTFPDDIRQMGFKAFSNTGLTSVTLPKYLEPRNGEDRYVFAGNNSLKSVTIPGTVKTIPNGMFNNCKLLTTVKIGNGVQQIGANAFSFDPIEQITIPNTVESIDSDAFFACKLKSLVIPESVTSMGGGVFSSNHLLGNVKYYAQCNVPYGIFSVCENLTTIEFGPKTPGIDYFGMINCNGLKDVYIGANVTYIDPAAFWNMNQPMNFYTSQGSAAYYFAGEHSNITFVSCGTVNAAPWIKAWEDDTIKKVTASNTNITLSLSSYTYSGKACRPAPTVKYGTKKLAPGADFTYKYSNNTNVGTATITFTFQGKYEGTLKKTFIINPKKPTVTALAPIKKGFKLTWRAVTPQATGYQVQYSLRSNFASSKTYTIKNYKTTSIKVAKLAAGKPYYVRMRTYRTAAGKNYFSAWTTRKAVKPAKK